MAGQGCSGRLHAFFVGELDEAVVCALRESLVFVVSQVALSRSTAGLNAAVCQLVAQSEGGIQLQARWLIAGCSVARKAHAFLGDGKTCCMHRYSKGPGLLICEASCKPHRSSGQLDCSGQPAAVQSSSSATTLARTCQQSRAPYLHMSRASYVACTHSAEVALGTLIRHLSSGAEGQAWKEAHVHAFAHVFHITPAVTKTLEVPDFVSFFSWYPVRHGAW